MIGHFMRAEVDLKHGRQIQFAARRRATTPARAKMAPRICWKTEI